MGQKEKKQNQEEVIELTEVVEEGPVFDNTKDMAEVIDESNLDKELNELFSDAEEDTPPAGGTEKEKDTTPRTEDAEEEDLDIDSLFEELEKGETNPEEPAEKIKEEDLTEGLSAVDEKTPDDEPSSEPDQNLEEALNGVEPPPDEGIADEFDDLLETPKEGDKEEGLEQVLEKDFDLEDLAAQAKNPSPEDNNKQVLERLEALENTVQDLQKKELTEQIQNVLEQVLPENPVLQTLEEQISSKLANKLERQIITIVDERLAALKAELQPERTDINSDEEGDRVADLKEQIASLEEKTLKRIDLESIKAELLTELTTTLEKLVPQTAAKIIREEIEALAEEDL